MSTDETLVDTTGMIRQQLFAIGGIATGDPLIVEGVNPKKMNYWRARRIKPGETPNAVAVGCAVEGDLFLCLVRRTIS